MKKTLAALVLCTAAFLTACESNVGGGGSDDENQDVIPISFGISSSALAPTAARAFNSRQAAPAPSVTVVGSNGTLDITRIAVLVEEFELEPVEVEECDVEPKPASCADFEQRYFFIDVPVDGTQVTVMDADIPDGNYKKLEFEIDDIEIDDDPEEAADADLIDALFADVRAEFPNWPEEASIVVIGTFTPTGGDPVDFTTYFEAEIEVELEFDIPLTVPDDSNDGIMIALHPELWFTRSDGTVMDLSQLQNQVVEFEVELEDGFELEFDEEDDD